MQHLNNLKHQRSLFRTKVPVRIAILLIIACVLINMAGATKQITVTPSLFGVSESHFTEAQICRRCHPDHFEMWSQSMHAMALQDPMFQVSFLQAQAEEGIGIRDYCLTCHAPVAAFNRDYALTLDLTGEAVACDFCHTITGVHPGRKPLPYDNKPGAIKFGPIEATATPAHHTQNSPLFKTAEFCSGCHELVNEHGVLVMGTYTEWRESPYPDAGIHCQNCHMPLSLRPTAITFDGDTLPNLAHDHSFQGGHSQINLKHAATLESFVQISSSSAQVEIFITNKESGHKLPTGTPARRVVLKVSVFDQFGKLLAQPTRTYRKVLVDRDGTILEGNSNQILHSVRVFSDNRIAPKEIRREVFLIDLPPNTTGISLTAKLLYEFETPVMYTQMIQTEMAAIKGNYPVKNTAFSAPLPSRWNLKIILISILSVVGLFLGLLLAVRYFRISRSPSS